MAQLLYEKQSTKVHLNATNRHVRLCRRSSGTEQAIAAIEPFYKTLVEKQQATEEASLNREMAHDDVYHFDDILDDEVRSCFEDCKQYDRKNPGRPVLNLVFPDGKFTTIINAPLNNEPDKVEQLVSRIESLGAEHPLNKLVAGLKSGIANCRATLVVYHDSITTQKSAEAVEEIAKANLRRQYEFNYLDLVKQFGKRHANRFFPILRSNNKASNTDEAEDNSESVGLLQ